MKEEIIKILITLHENKSWDLSKELAIGLFNTQEFKLSYIDSILSFLQTAHRLIQDEIKKENIGIAITQLQKLRQKEIDEKQEENQNLENIFDDIF